MVVQRGLHRSRPFRPRPRDGSVVRGDPEGVHSIRQAIAVDRRSVPALQRLAGNAAVAQALLAADCCGPRSPVVQRDLDDQGQVGEGTLGDAGPVSQPDLAETGGGGGELMVENVNEFGEYDGLLTTSAVPHAFSDKGQVASGKWLHCGGTGGKGNEGTGSSTVVAPVYESKPATATKPAKASVRKGTGKVKVTRSWNGVVPGDNGTATWAGSGGGRVFVMWSAVARIATHEKGHVKETKKFHDAEIKPLEKRIKATQTGATEAAAVTAMQTHVNWNATLASFAAKDTAMNTPGGTFDTTDQAKANFYHDKGPKKIKKITYAHFIEAP